MEYYGVAPEKQMGDISAEIQNAPKEIRRAFIRKVYALLLMQLVITLVIATQIYSLAQESGWYRSHEWLLWLSIVSLFGSMCVMVCFDDILRRWPLNLVFLLIFTILESVMIGFVSAMFTWKSLLLATGATVGIVLLLTMYAFQTKTDFTGMGPYLFVGLCTLIVFSAGFGFLQASGVDLAWSYFFWDGFGVLLFCFYIVFDTQNILGEYGGHRNAFSIDDSVYAALSLYLDIINLFLHFIELLSRATDA